MTVKQEKAVSRIVCFAIGVGDTFLNALYLMRMWAWFAIPASGGKLPELNYWLAFGVMMFLRFFVRGTADSGRHYDTIEDVAWAVSGMVVAAILFGVAALVRLGVPA